MKAALAYLRRASVPGKFMDSLVDLVASEALLPADERLIGDRIIRLQYPPYPNTGRNKLVAHFLDSNPPSVAGLLMVDDDNVFETWQPAALCDCLDPVERPIVSGLYFAWDEDRQLARPILLDERQTTMWDYPAGLVERATVGMGFCAIHRSILEQWRAEHGDTWFDYATGDRGEFVIEDRAFCERMRARGHRVFVNTQIKLGHMKLVDVNERLFGAVTKNV